MGQFSGSDVKQDYLRKAAAEAASAHPEDTPYSLRCNITLGIPEEPVYFIDKTHSKDGKTHYSHLRLYEKDTIMRWLKAHSTDPVSQNPLKKEDLIGFTELTTHIQTFRARQDTYNNIKQELLEQARAATHKKPEVEEFPSIFLDPISKTMIQSAVITPKGKIYDKTSLQSFLSTHHNQDETGQTLRLEDCRDFREFQSHINMHKTYWHTQLAEKQREEARRKALATPAFPLANLYGFFKRTLNLVYTTPEKDHQEHNRIR